MTKILSADDDLEIQELLRFTLENEGYTVITVNDGDEALEKIKTEKPDLVILDVMMPKMTGYEACEKLREDPATCLLPIIMLTSMSQAKDRITGIKLGADEYLVKPFEPLEVTARIEGLLKRVQKEVYLNPLTQLPGNNIFESEIKNRLNINQSVFNVYYLDINNFKAYNSKYGYDRGDNIIKLTAGILRSCVSELNEKDSLIAHFGGDDFGIITSALKPDSLARNIIDVFGKTVSKQYDESDRQQELHNPLLTVAVGTVVVKQNICKHYSEVIDRVRDVWKQAKTKAGDTYIIS
jgi:diguanylate cyclase (GGDEF)-like protein